MKNNISAKLILEIVALLDGLTVSEALGMLIQAEGIIKSASRLNTKSTTFKQIRTHVLSQK